jgi:hypothetical protein
VGAGLISAWVGGFESRVANLEGETNPKLGSPELLRRFQRKELGLGNVVLHPKARGAASSLPAYAKQKNKQERDGAGS